MARISVFAGICTSTSPASGRAYDPVTGCEPPELLPGVEPDAEPAAGLAPLEVLPEVEADDALPGVAFAGEFAGGAVFAGDSEEVAGAPFTLADGGTGRVDAAGLVLLAGVALLSCAGTCDCGELTEENDVPFWPNASTPSSKTNTTYPDTLPTIRLRHNLT